MVAIPADWRGAGGVAARTVSREFRFLSSLRKPYVHSTPTLQLAGRVIEEGHSTLRPNDRMKRTNVNSLPHFLGEPRRTLGEARRPGWGRFVRIARCVVNCDATSSDHGGGLAAPGAARCGGSESTAGQSLRQPLGRLLVQPGRQELQRCEQRAGLRSTAGLPERPVPAVHGGLGVQLQ